MVVNVCNKYLCCKSSIQISNSIFILPNTQFLFCTLKECVSTDYTQVLCFSAWLLPFKAFSQSGLGFLKLYILMLTHGIGRITELILLRCAWKIKYAFPRLAKIFPRYPVSGNISLTSGRHILFHSNSVGPNLFIQCTLVSVSA